MSSFSTLAEEARAAAAASTLTPGWRLPSTATPTDPLYTGKGSGIGSRVYDDGDVYEGEFVDGRRHGWGKYVESTGNCYTGPYVKDKMETGPGEVAICTYANGNMCVSSNQSPYVRGLIFNLRG